MLKIGLFLFVTAVTICYGTRDILDNVGFFKIIKEKCYQNSTGDEYEKFVNSSISSANCFRSMDKELFSTPLQDLKDNIQKCFNDLVSELERCLPEDSKKWPQLNIDIIFSILDFVYDNQEQIQSPEFQNDMKTCAAKFREAQVLAKCLRNYDTKPLNAETLCEVLYCTVNEFDRVCPTEADTEELKKNFLVSVRQPCEEDEEEEDDDVSE